MQILDSDGKSMQHCVENSMEKTAERLTKLDKGGRLVSVVDSPYMQVADPTTMIRQVHSYRSCIVGTYCRFVFSYRRVLHLVPLRARTSGCVHVSSS